jgi:hypothetical protein
MLALLPTCTGFSVPQTFAVSIELGLPPQVKAQSTPRLGPSLTLTLTFAVEFTTTEVSWPLPPELVTEIELKWG